jgi:hypothetical protein
MWPLVPPFHALAPLPILSPHKKKKKKMEVEKTNVVRK